MDSVRQPDGETIKDSSGPIGLAFCGAGIKASLVHVGSLARLAELDLLRKVDVISGVSGGALVAALYYLHLKRTLDAEGEIDTPGLISLVATVERHLLDVVQTDLRARLFTNMLSNVRRIEASYTGASRLGDLLDHHLFKPVWSDDRDGAPELRELAIHPRGDSDFNPITDNANRYCKVPRLVIHAANADSGHPWRFEADGMGEPFLSAAAQQLANAPRLAKTSYHRLPKAYSGLTLGQAVAASMATPGLLEPLTLSRLYPAPDNPASFQNVRLADGARADAFGTDVLTESGCSHCIVCDGGGLTAVPGAVDPTMRMRQLDELKASRPGRIAFIHLRSELETIDIKPTGPISEGRIIKDRMNDDLTSYGVERSLQEKIVAIRADLDAPSEIEAMTLMADGYLLTKRAFERLRLNGAAWPTDPPIDGGPWRFSAMFEPLRDPPPALVKHLRVAKHESFRGPRLAKDQAVKLGLCASAFSLSLIALGSIWSAMRPISGEDSWWMIATGGLLTMIAWVAGWPLYELVRHRFRDGWKRWISVVSWKIGIAALALPLWLIACFRRYASRTFLAVGRLKTIGIEPVSITETPPKPDAEVTKLPVRRRMRKAA
jgi:NTE family protein